MDIVDKLELCQERTGLKWVGIREDSQSDGSAYSQVKNKTRPPSRRFILEVCKQFNVSEEWLETGQGKCTGKSPERSTGSARRFLRVIHTENAFSDIIEVILEM